MKFYSKIVSKPNSIIEEVRDAQKVINRVLICTFINGVLETDDPKIIAKLEARKDLFRTDRPWKQKPDWRITEEGIKLLKEGERLGIDCRHIREFYLKQRIQEILHPKSKTPEEPEVNKKKTVSSQPPQANQPTMDYKEIIRQAKAKGIKTHKVKKQVLLKALGR